MIVTCAYGQFIPDEIINCPKYGCINVHGSLLPKLRGGAPIHWAIINGDKVTGMTVMSGSGGWALNFEKNNAALHEFLFGKNNVG